MTSGLCQDCHLYHATVTYGLGHKRCRSCSARFDEQVRIQRARRAAADHSAKEEHINARERDRKCPDDGEVCEECCEHDFDTSEGGMCLECGKDGYAA